ncbi:MAG: hypothetical protein E7653_07180 [Ruminococcaceae bacterium]|nr:hypothetical protein [Oscillospiraceae bacterium]
MNLYLKQKHFSWDDKFYVYDANDNKMYYVEGEIQSWGKKLHLYDLFGNEKIFISQKMTSVLPRYTINMGSHTVAEVERQFLFKNEYKVTELDWRVRGNFEDEYTIENGRRVIATVSKQGEGQEIRISFDSDELMALSIVLVIDACIEAKTTVWNHI